MGANAAAPEPASFYLLLPALAVFVYGRRRI
jgi:hypothetical protein